MPHYVTCGKAGREVEIGSFLTEEERIALYDDLLRDRRPAATRTRPAIADRRYPAQRRSLTSGPTLPKSIWPV